MVVSALPQILSCKIVVDWCHVLRSLWYDNQLQCCDLIEVRNLLNDHGVLPILPNEIASKRHVWRVSRMKYPEWSDYL